MGRPNEPPIAEPIAYFLTWSTYGTWLPGDARGWQKRRRGTQPPSQALRLDVKARMSEAACLLDLEQRSLVGSTIASQCVAQQWSQHACSCRTNHVHLVITAPIHPDKVREQLKARCSRDSNRLEAERMANTGATTNVTRRKWWAERGSSRYLNDEDSLEAAVLYVQVGQDRGGSKANL